METGVNGKHGERVASLAAAEHRPESEIATVHLLLMVEQLVLVQTVPPKPVPRQLVLMVNLNIFVL